MNATLARKNWKYISINNLDYFAFGSWCQGHLFSFDVEICKETGKNHYKSLKL